MEATDIAKLCETLSLSEKEGPIVHLDASLKKIGMDKMNLCSVGKIISSKIINREAFCTVIPKIWKMAQDVEIEVLSTNVFVFHFRNLRDRQRILTGGPWNFDRSLLVLEQPRGNGYVDTMSFSMVEFWVQVHNVPLVCMTKDIGLFIGRQIVEVYEIDLGATGDCYGKFLHIKILVDVRKPLRRCVRIDLDGSGTISTMLLKYERLPEFCFQCGILGHATRECLDLNHEIMGGSQKFEYGTWLRATSPVRIRKDTTPRSHSPSNNDDGAGVTSGCATQDINVDGVHQQAGDPVHDTVLPMQNLKDAVDTSMTLPTATVIAPILPIPGKLSNDNFEVSHVSR
ncbi:hypothetical protein ACOSQ3_005104 [Xanthoceras sorbifolium]